MSAYNSEKYIRESIDSLLGQTFKDWELIVIDDNSTDGTVKIVNDYKERDIRVFLLRSEANIGPEATKNIGLSVAKGKYIAILDSDDLAAPNRLEIQYQYLEQNPQVSLVGSFVTTIDENGKPIGDTEQPTDFDMIKFILINKNCFTHSSIMFRKEVVARIGGYCDNVRNAGEYDLYSRLSTESMITNITLPLVYYRIHPNSVLTSPDSRKIARHNSKRIVTNNWRRYVNITERDIDIISNTMLAKFPNLISARDLYTTIRLYRNLFKNYIKKEKSTAEQIQKILPIYKQNIKFIIKRYCLSKYKQIKKSAGIKFQFIIHKCRNLKIFIYLPIFV